MARQERRGPQFHDEQRRAELAEITRQAEAMYPKPHWTEHLRLSNLMRFGAFWVILGAIFRLVYGG